MKWPYNYASPAYARMATSRDAQREPFPGYNKLIESGRRGALIRRAKRVVLPRATDVLPPLSNVTHSPE